MTKGPKIYTYDEAIEKMDVKLCDFSKFIFINSMKTLFEKQNQFLSSIDELEKKINDETIDSEERRLMKNDKSIYSHQLYLVASLIEDIVWQRTIYEEEYENFLLRLIIVSSKISFETE